MNKLSWLILLLMGLTSCYPNASIFEAQSPLPMPPLTTNRLPDSPLSMPTSTPPLAVNPDVSCLVSSEEPGAVAALQAEYQLAEETFLRWYCAGAGVGDIRKAYEVQAATGQPIEAIFAQFFAGVGWGEIRQPAAQPAIDPEEQLCLAEHTSHREVMNIAEAFTQPAERIAGLFCQGMGFGEIRNAVAIHQETGEPLEKIGALFLERRDWAAIRAALGAAPLQGDQTGND